MQQRIIDTHIHVWNFDKAKYSWLDGNTSILNRNYDLEELENERLKAGITDGILVQAANNFEDTGWMLQVAETHGWIKGVVGWLPLMQPAESARALEKYKLNIYFKGVRHLIHDEQNSKWLLQKEVLESLQLLADHHIPFDVVGVLPVHIETVLEVAAKIPTLKMVFDHLNQPPISQNKGMGVWGDLMKQAAAHQNFYTKISGLGLTANKQDWSSEDIKPYVAFVFEHFGESRCFCGGDWPVSLLADSYSKTWSIYKQAINELTNENITGKIYYSNAANFYQL